jgi:hypothetical protein
VACGNDTRGRWLNTDPRYFIGIRTVVARVIFVHVEQSPESLFSN